MSEPLKFGAMSRAGETTCGFGVDRRDCDKPAVWHLLWLDSNHTSMTCAEHLDYINSRSHPDYDIHTFGSDCGMPGAMWHMPYEDEDEGYCFFPANDDASAMEQAAPALVDGGVR